MTGNTPKSRGEMIIEQLMRELDPGSSRYQILATAKRFKSSWVELGEKLLEVQKASLFREWGYDSFEDYCSREIRIKKPTAQKLTMAYRFLEKEEPELLARHTELKPFPDYRTMDLLRRAREEQDFSAEEYADLRKAALEDERSHPTVLKQFKEVAAVKGDSTAVLALSYRSALASARRLATALQALPDLPQDFSDQLEEIIDHLEQRVEGE